MKKDTKTRIEYIWNDYMPLNVKEAYKGIRTNIEFAMDSEECKRIMVSSPVSETGNTSVCINLAVSFANTGAKVLVIDCDLRSPRVHQLLGGKTLQGVAEVLQGKSVLKEILQTSSHENLDFIGAGGKTANPSELLNSSSMKLLIQELAQYYEYIFINTPPINLVTDGRALASQMNGVVLVVKQDQTAYKDLEDCLEHLRKVNAHVLGTVLNQCRVSIREKKRYKIYDKEK